jgi:uncharacterized protein (DUF2147 family)
VLAEWLVESGDARVEIYKAADGTYEGRLCWLKEPEYPAGDPEAGKPRRDRDNPDKALRDRPMQGLVFMTGFRYDGEGKWKGGKVYDAESGKTYSCKMTLKDRETLEIRGYIGVSLLGRNQTWKRHPGT